jgi:prephenate dehydratase
LTRLGFLGPEGTFSHEALLATGVAGTSVALPSVHEVVLAVQDGRVERSLAPIENAIEGAVNATLDALAFDAPGVAVVGEVVHPVHHCLVAAAPLALDAITGCKPRSLNRRIQPSVGTVVLARLGLIVR